VSVFFEDSKARQDHGQKSLRGGLVSVLARAVNALVQVGSVVFLARLLTPEDYGLVTMVTAITGFAPILVDLGTRDAVAQRDRITQGEVSALFWISMAVGSGFALLVALSGPLISRFYDEPRLATIALVSSLTVLASALACQHQGLLRRAMMFRQVAMIEVGANVVGAGTAIGMAFSGLGYWALVVRPLVTGLFTAIGVWCYCRWLPPKPTLTSGVKEMLRFGVNLTGFSIADFVGRCADSVAIGRVSGPERLGYYRKALLVYENLLDLTISLHGVAAVSLSKLRDNLDELRRLWAKGLSTLSFYAMPAFGGVAVTSYDLIYLVLGERWQNAGILLSVLALRGIPHVVERTLGWLHVAAGRSDRWMRWGMLEAGVQLVALFCGLPYGPMGVATAYVVAMFLIFVPTIAYAGLPLGISAKDVLRAVWQPLVGTLVAVGTGFLLHFLVLPDMPRLPRLILVGFAFTAMYLILVPGIFKLRTPLTVILKLRNR
jgi:PST family polysaccharide transporter